MQKTKKRRTKNTPSPKPSKKKIDPDKEDPPGERDKMPVQEPETEKSPEIKDPPLKPEKPKK